MVQNHGRGTFHCIFPVGDVVTSSNPANRAKIVVDDSYDAIPSGYVVVSQPLRRISLTPRSLAIAVTLQAQHATFLSLAAKTAALDADLQKVKAVYTQLWRAQTGSVRDPFNDIDRAVEKGGDFGMGGLNVSTK